MRRTGTSPFYRCCAHARAAETQDFLCDIRAKLQSAIERSAPGAGYKRERLCAVDRAFASKSRTGWTLDCHFVGRRVKSEKPQRSSSLSRPINTALQAAPTTMPELSKRLMAGVQCEGIWVQAAPDLT